MRMNIFTSPKSKYLHFFPDVARTCNICKTMQLTKLAKTDTNKISKIYNSAMLLEKTGRSEEFSQKRRKLACSAWQNAVAMAMSNAVERQLTRQNLGGE